MVWLYSKLANPVLKGGILKKGKGGEGGQHPVGTVREPLSVPPAQEEKPTTPRGWNQILGPFLLPRQPSHVAFLVIFRVHSLLPFLALRSLASFFSRTRFFSDE